MKKVPAVEAPSDQPGSRIPGEAAVRVSDDSGRPKDLPADRDERELTCPGRTVFTEPCSHAFTAQKICPWCGKADIFLAFALHSLVLPASLIEIQESGFEGVTGFGAWNRTSVGACVSGDCTGLVQITLVQSCGIDTTAQAVTLWRYARQQAAQQRSSAGTMNKTAVTVILSSFR